MYDWIDLIPFTLTNWHQEKLKLMDATELHLFINNYAFFFPAYEIVAYWVISVSKAGFGINTSDGTV